MTPSRPQVPAEEATGESPLQLGLDFATDRDWYFATERWVKENPGTYRLFVEFALEMGRVTKRFGFKAIAERVRWEMAIQGRSSEWKVNNSLTAYIARRVVREHPGLTEKVEFRKVRFGPSGG